MKTRMRLGLAGLLAIGAVSASHGGARVGVDGYSAERDEPSAAHPVAIEEVVVHGVRVSFAPDEQRLAAELREEMRAMHERLKAALRIELAELETMPEGTDIPLVVNLPQA